jgi:membrane associated rhomboid family serine protease
MPLSFPPASFAILILIVAVSALGLMSAPGIIERNLLRPYYVVRRREYSTLITCGFVHADFGHLFFNSMTLYFFGPTLEMTIGTPRFLALYFICLLTSSLGTVIKQRNNPDYASLGASGAILGVLFAYIVYYPTAMLGLFFVVPVPAVLFAFGYLAYTIWASKNQIGRINHDAHLDGALTGLLFVAFTDFDIWRRAFRVVGNFLGS